MSDWLEAAKQACDDALNTRPGSPEQQHLLQVADTHARIATAEALRALLGVIVALPETDLDPESA